MRIKLFAIAAISLLLTFVFACQAPTEPEVDDPGTQSTCDRAWARRSRLPGKYWSASGLSNVRPPGKNRVSDDSGNSSRPAEHI